MTTRKPYSGVLFVGHHGMERNVMPPHLRRRVEANLHTFHERRLAIIDPHWHVAGFGSHLVILHTPDGGVTDQEFAQRKADIGPNLRYMAVIGWPWPDDPVAPLEIAVIMDRIAKGTIIPRD
jgi:hypothetical protein